MNKEQFVESVKHEASDAAVRSTLERLSRPAGRRPSTQALELASWYGNLNLQEKSYIEKIVRETAESAVFGLLAILDGVRVIEGPGLKGEFELYYRKGVERVLLNDPNQELLHDVFSHII